MQIDLSMYPEDNAYEVETHMIKEEVETADQLAYLFSQFAIATGFTFVETVVFYDSKHQAVASSNIF